MAPDHSRKPSDVVPFRGIEPHPGRRRPPVLQLSACPFDVQLFAGEKTEPATEKKREDARQQGNVPKSQDLASVLILIAAVIALRLYGAQLFGMFAQFLRYTLESSMQTPLTLGNALILLNQVGIMILKCTAPFFAVIILASVAVNLYQVGFLFRFDPMIPNLDRLNPISGLQNVFSWKMIAELVKSILKIMIVGYIPYSTIRDNMPLLMRLFQLEPMQSLIVILDLIFGMVLKILLILLVLAVGDWFFQLWRHEENLKMSKEDIKEEYKQREGDPKVKAKIRERQRKIATRRMMQEVPKATVVVTNPTHIAVALRYEQDQDSAPLVVAMGTGLIAQRIKEIAKEHGVPVIENKPLAQTLHKMVDVGDEIPRDLYNAVAEILAQVYRLRGRAAAAA
jgi:flagellar biosynthesis protein FlhB